MILNVIEHLKFLFIAFVSFYNGLLYMAPEKSYIMSFYASLKSYLASLLKLIFFFKILFCKLGIAFTLHVTNSCFKIFKKTFNLCVHL